MLQKSLKSLGFTVYTVRKKTPVATCVLMNSFTSVKQVIGEFSTLRSRIRNHAVTDYKNGNYAYSFTMYEGPNIEVTIKGKCHGIQDFRLYHGTERF